MNCSCNKVNNKKAEGVLINKLQEVECELVGIARNILSNANDPFSAIIKFLHERPEDSSLTGYVMDYVLAETFGQQDNIPSLIRILGKHVREIIRQSNVISIVNEHPAVEKWGDYLIKQTERIKFEIAKERELLVLKNIAGLFAIEHGIAVPLDKITVQPPHLIVTLNLGLIHPSRVVDILPS